MPERSEGSRCVPLAINMKIAITGKGGTGKTTIAACLARHWAAQGREVIAIDADPDANLAAAVGLPESTIVPLVDMKDLIAERTDSQPDSYGTYFKINPQVSDIPEKFWKEHAGVRVMNFGTVSHGGAGCICPASVFLKALLTHIVLQRNEVVVVDMEAGLEHLGRATATGVDTMAVVLEPGMRSVETAVKTKELAKQIGIKKLVAIGNKISNSDELEFLKANCGDLHLAGTITYRDNIRKADMNGVSPYDTCPELVEEISSIAAELDQ